MPENIKTAAYAAQLSPEERKKIDDFNKAYAAHKELSDLPSNVANQVFNSKTPEQQADLIKNFGNEDPTVKQQRGWFGTAWHYTGGAVANAIGIAGSKTLAGLGNVSDFMTRVARTGLIAADQNVALIGAGGAWDIANDKGDKVFSPGRIQDATKIYGKDVMSVAMKVASGMSLSEVIATGSAAEQEIAATGQKLKDKDHLLNDAIAKANAAKYSPGRQLANLILPENLEGRGFLYKGISGVGDAGYRIFADPTLALGKAKKAYDAGNFFLFNILGKEKFTYGRGLME